MAAATSLEALRELAEFRAAKGCAISVYLDLEPQSTLNPGDVQTRVNSLLDGGSRNPRFDLESMSRDQKLALKEDIGRIQRFFSADLDRGGLRAFALFCSSLDNLWRELPLPYAVTDDARLGRELYLAPLLPVVGKGEGTLVAVVSRERGEVYRLRGGRLHEIANETQDVPNQHDQGGWSQARYQRHIDEVVARHLRNVTQAIDRIIRREPSTKLVIVATEEIRPDIESELAKESRAAICGWATAEAHATAHELLEAAMPVVERARAEKERAALERWREEAARDGRASAGWERTLEAASDGRVELLLVQERANHEAYECPQCGRGSVVNGNCPLDGTLMEKRPDGLDLAVHRTLEHGGGVWLAQHSDDLAPVEGIGALLRY
jgi:peptide chain release factor subunit 1